MEEEDEGAQLDRLDALVAVQDALEKIESESTLDEGHRCLQDLMDVKKRSAEYASVAALCWHESGGASRCVQYIDTCDFEHVDEKRLVLHLRTLRAAIRASEEVLEKVIGMLCVEALARLLVECDGERITKEAMRTVAMTAHSGAGRDHLQATHSIAVLMCRANRENEDVLLLSVLPRMLCDVTLATQFCEEGGVAYLHGIVTLEDQSLPRLSGCVAVIELVAKHTALVRRMIEEEGFVDGVVSLLSNTKLDRKVQLHVIKCLYALASDQIGLGLVEHAVLPLMEMLEDEDLDALAVTVAAMELISLLCNSRSALEIVDECGGEDFVGFVLCFLSSKTRKVLEPLCGLLHILSLGRYREMILTELRKYATEKPHIPIFGVTLDLIEGGSSAKRKAEAASVVGEDETITDAPTRRQSSSEAIRARMIAKRAHLLKELVSSEHTYSVALFTTVKCFLTPLCKMELLSVGEKSHVFMNLEDLYAIHKTFMKKLDSAFKTGGNIAALLQQVYPSMEEAYEVYVRGFNDASRYLQIKMKSPKFRQHCWDLSKEVVQGSLSLENYLTLPVRRLARYGGFLQELDNFTMSDSFDKADIGKCLTTFRQGAEKMETLLNSTARGPVQAAAEVSPSSSIVEPRSLSKTASGHLSKSLGYVPAAMLQKVSSEGIRLVKHRRENSVGVGGTNSNHQDADAGSPAVAPIPIGSSRSPHSSPPSSPRSGSIPVSPGRSLAPPRAAASNAVTKPSPSTPPSLASSSEPKSVSSLKSVTPMIGSPVLSRVLDQSMSDNMSMVSGISNRISSAYGVSEKLRMVSNKSDPSAKYSYSIKDPRDNVMGYGFSKDKMFIFVDLEGTEVLNVPLTDIAKSRKK